MTRLRRLDAWICLALFALNVALTYPLFLPGDTPYRDSIEGGYAGMARFVDAQPNPWGWNPFQYCGLPTQFLYVPALHYAVAILPGDPVYVYKLLTAVLACLGPATLYLAFVFFTGNRCWAVITAIAYTFLSPLYGMAGQADRDRGLTYLPWRMHVFAKYGEGPHNAGLTLMPLAWITTWLAATTYRYKWILTLALLMAGITLTNWIAGLALAMTTVLLMLSAIGTSGFRPSRVFMAGAIAYGLGCFWLTPTFIKTIAFNWPADAFNYKLQIAQYHLFTWYLATLTVVLLVVRFLRWPAHYKFFALSLVAFGFPVLLHYSYAIDLMPESRRYAIEFELFFMACLGGFFHVTMVGRNRIRLTCALIAAIAIGVAGAKEFTTYLIQSRQPLKPLPIETTPEFKAARWLADRKPEGRVLVSGGLRFRLNSWFDVAQAGGTFESGLRNRTPVHFAYHIRTALDVQDSINELKALGVEYVAIHGPKSAEHYRDYKYPEKFEGVLEKVYADEDNDIYRVPFSGLAHAVRRDEFPPHAFRDAIGAYVRALNDPSRPRLTTKWIGLNQVRIDGAVPEGMLLSVQISHDDGWRAFSGGREIPVQRDELGFMRIEAHGPVELRYKGTLEQKLCALVSALTWIGAVSWLWKNRA